jgi:cholesterol oxidase
MISLIFLRITFIFGLLWEHKNLTELTHNTLHEFFGHVTTLVNAQLALTMRWQKLVSASGEDIYLPESDKGLKSPVYKEHINRLNLPIRFIVGKLELGLFSQEFQCSKPTIFRGNRH